VSTRDAYRAITPHIPAKCCKEIVKQPIETWKAELSNDFEEPAFLQYPELKAIKEKLYEMGAIYAQMSGSGSTIFGIFKENPGEKNIKREFGAVYHQLLQL
jgi:4-diphosphocytidyl-2-C-methyl-D-erythritol kinase